MLTAAGSYPWLLAQVLTVARAGNTAASGRRKNPSPRASAHADSSSATACISSPTFSMLKTLPASFSAIEPVPERRAEVEPVVQVLRLDEDVRVEQIGHQKPIPRLRPSSLEGRHLLERRAAGSVSVNDVRPSSVLTTSARAKRLADARAERQIEVAAAALAASLRSRSSSSARRRTRTHRRSAAQRRGCAAGSRAC